MQKYKKLSDLANQLLDKGILVDPKKEQDFCINNRMLLSRNSNGSVTYGCYGLSSDYKNCRVDLNVYSGSGNDKKGKEGGHHLLEHLLFSKSLRDLHVKNDVNSNASTSGRRIQYYIEGLNDYDHKDFGVPNVLKKSINSVLYPKTLDDKDYLGYEKEVIKKEIDEENSDFYRVSQREFDNLLFEEDSFMRVNIMGTTNSVETLTNKDIKKIFNNYFNPTNTILVLSGEGTQSDYTKLFNDLNLISSKFKRKGVQNYKDKINDPKIKNINSFNYLESKIDTIKNNMCAVGFVIKLYSPVFSSEEWTLGAATGLLSKLFFERIRDKGLVYSATVDRYSFYNGDQLFYCVGYVSSNNANYVMEQMAKEFNILIKELLKKDRLEKLLEGYKKLLMCTPLSFSNKVKDFYNYFPIFKYLPDSGALRNARADISKSDINNVATKLLENKKVLYKIGDF